MVRMKEMEHPCFTMSTGSPLGRRRKNLSSEMVPGGISTQRCARVCTTVFTKAVGSTVSLAAQVEESG